MPCTGEGIHAPFSLLPTRLCPKSPRPHHLSPATTPSRCPSRGASLLPAPLGGAGQIWLCGAQRSKLEPSTEQAATRIICRRSQRRLYTQVSTQHWVVSTDLGPKFANLGQSAKGAAGEKTPARKLLFASSLWEGRGAAKLIAGDDRQSWTP